MSAPPPTVPATPCASLELQRALDALEQVRRDVLDRERGFASIVSALPAEARPSARNLVHYLGLRAHDLEPVQRVLAAHGLSSLGRAEPHVLANLDAVLCVLRALTGRGDAPADGERPPRSRSRTASGCAGERADALFGPAPALRRVRIMATMPTEAAAGYALVRELLAGGMDCMRINCAHDGPEAWTGMVENLRRARRELGRPCAVLMDLPGPRVRTGAVQPGPRVVKVRPERDELGRVLRPARLWLTAAEAPVAPPAPADAVLADSRRPARRAGARRPAALSRRARRAAADAGGGSRRGRRVGGADEDGVRRHRNAPCGCAARTGASPWAPWASSPRFGAGSAWPRATPWCSPATRRPGAAPSWRATAPWRSPRASPAPRPEALASVRPGARVWFDDGHIGGVVSSVDGEGVRVRITHARAGGRLGAEKGVNFPDTDLGLPALMPDDLRILPFVCGHADLAGYSFARSAADVRRLRKELEGAGAPEMGVILKIETTGAFQELPMMLLEALRCRAAGVMIARGDLAVEVGFERLAEVQEEILWMCEAAHVPVVWATQVLEQLTREGSPSRAEVSDAALGERAECVMLNKGPYLADAVRTLDDILARMHRHQEKKRPLLAHLGVADHFFSLVPVDPASAAAMLAVAPERVPA